MIVRSLVVRMSHRAALAALVPALLAGLARCSSNGSTSTSSSDGGPLGDSTTADTSTSDSSLSSETAPEAAVDSQSGAEAGVEGAAGDAGVDAGSTDASDASAADAASDALYDPQPTACDAGGMPPPVGGTAACPDDKNLPGCPCATAGASASCWTGYRKNRDHGDCKDGMTTCTSSAGSLSWGACNGEVLPTSGSGKAMCDCFSTGDWQIDNLEPCSLTATDSMGNMTTTMYASTQGNPATCPFDMTTGAPIVPASWSTDTLTVDCSGQFTLCYTLKAGDPNNPQPADCVLASVCTQAHYAPAGTAVALPPLPGWSTDSTMAACVAQFQSTGGYGAMSVAGQSDECESVSRVFQSVTYCAIACNGANPPPQCATCMAGGGGPF